MDRLHVPAAALALLLGAAPAAGQTLIGGFARSDQSDVSGVALTSADLLGFEPGIVQTFTCPVAWGVRTTSDALRGELSARDAAGAGLLPLLEDGPGAGDAGARLAAALSAGNSAAGARAARALVPRLRGLLAAASRMDPARPGDVAATRLNASVTQFNAFVDASDPAFLAASPPEMTALRTVLGRLVASAEEHDGRIADPDAPRPAGTLACAPPPPVAVAPPPVVTPQPPPAAIRVCVMQGGTIREVAARFDPVTRDTLVDGVRFPGALAGGAEYAASRAFFIEDHPVVLDGRRYVKYGTPRVLGPGELVRGGEFMGVPVFVATGGRTPAEVVYLPVAPACEFQPYQLEIKAGGVRGD